MSNTMLFRALPVMPTTGLLPGYGDVLVLLTEDGVPLLTEDTEQLLEEG